MSRRPADNAGLPPARGPRANRPSATRSARATSVLADEVRPAFAGSLAPVRSAAFTEVTRPLAAFADIARSRPWQTVCSRARSTAGNADPPSLSDRA